MIRPRPCLIVSISYGMMAQDPVKHSLIFKQVGDFDLDPTPDPILLEKNNRKAFLAYQWGVWVTAHARDALERGIRLVHDTPGAEFVYCDTDSVKYTGNVDWSAYNEERIAECKESGSYATDPAGKTHYMGVFEPEDDPETGYAYFQFKTLGAKKYAYVNREVETWKETMKIGDAEYTYTKVGPGRTHVTVAGVNKRKGGPELDKYGGLSAFQAKEDDQEGFVFRDAGGTMAVYNDDPEIKSMTIDGHQLQITSNVAILPSEYTLGITGEYERILKFAKSYIYNPYIL